MRCLLLLLMSGCAMQLDGSRRPTEKEAELIQNAASAWASNMPSVGAECEANTLKFRVVSYPSLLETGEACGYPPERLPPEVGIHACYIRDRHGIVLSQWHPTIIYWENSWLGLDYIFIHEYAHFASGCVWGNTDGNHSRVDVWNNFVYTYLQEN